MSRVQRFFKNWGRFFISIVLPTLTAILFTVLAIYLIIIPAFEKSFVDGKKVMLQELTKAAWNIMEFYYNEEQSGRLKRQQAQNKALSLMATLRYGEHNRDYFWVTDSTPMLIMHPYSQELIGQDLSSFTDTNGKKLFLEIKDIAARQSSGFVDYSWNKKYTEEMTVPKLSFVKHFQPWDWVVGTGVFLDDVEQRTAEISGRLSRMGMAAVAVLAFILLYVGRQSLLFERQRSRVQEELAKSRIKYKRLVEAATEPILMFFGGRCIYSNTPVQKLIGLSGEELENIEISKILAGIQEGAEQEGAELSLEEDGQVQEGVHHAFLLGPEAEKIEVALTVSKMRLDGREAAIVSIRDTSDTRQIEKELVESKEKYRQLTASLNIGVFRAQADSRMQVLEANHAFYSLLELEDDSGDLSLQEIFSRYGVPLNLYELVVDTGFVKNKVVDLQRRSGSASVSFSLVLTRNADGEVLSCDGILEDVSEEIRHDSHREKLIVELQTSLLFLNQPLRHVEGELLICESTLPVYRAAEHMRDNGCSSLLVENANKEIVGIATDMALRERVVAGRMDYTAPVAEIMSAPLIFIKDSALIFEAVMLMEEKGVKHLIVKDDSGQVVKVVSNEDLLNVHRYSSTFLVDEIRRAASIEEVAAGTERLPRIIKSLVDSGAHARNITRITSMISEAVLLRCIEFAIDDLGEPPASFAFISLGSEGRSEQTLATDQDNALIYEDVAENRQEEVRSYFLLFSEKVCTWLDQAGYVFCKGEVMAMNPLWCQPIAVWKDYFSRWITEAKPKDLLEVSIFFDFRCMYGEKLLVSSLRQHISRQVANRDAFFYQLAQNALLFRLPVDFFGNISVETGGEHPHTFNIKHVIALIVGYARLYAINFALEEANTLERLDRLKTRSFIGKELHDDITEAYNYLMQIRFRHQVAMLDKGEDPDNFISPDELNYMEKSALKKIFSQVGHLQNKLSAIGKVEIFF